MMRGKLHVEVLDRGFPGECPEGVPAVVAKVRNSINKRFQADALKPDNVMVDRGRGFHNPGTGRITPEYAQALRDQELKNVIGTDAAKQPGHMQEILLHATAVALIRSGLTRTVPKRCWLETLPDYGRRLKEVVDHINEHYDVEGLCRNLPKRIDDLIAAGGGRLKK